MTQTQIKINVFRSGGEWFGSCFVNDEFDGCDALAIDGDASEDEAMECARKLPLSVAGERTIARVDDLF